ncbi:amidohydrolase/deacetylase family metallohydrolase [Fusobacterium varium]|uniref:amidohydrolase/deacetylase family metallohydrolase n=1 Tax=Fusobacterium varium TaxID=856 RepID=UPI00242BD87B|nr:amidohydrolase/deacetylase family metallohydrolase [Fusobacterium varium]MCF0170887.1 amidohydrolase/deacetylase family metallohydrolase [Fusobacterium varium]
MKTVIKNGRLLDSKNNFHMTKADILIEDGIIKKIGENINEEGSKVIDVKNSIVAPGFIDIHVHCFPKGTAISSFPDEIGVKKGVTSIIDAGTSGADTIDDFYENFIKKSKTRIFSYLNIAHQGLQTLSELSDMKNINKEKIKEALEKYPEIIVGLKARASGSVVKENGVNPIAEGKKIASEFEVPLVVHIGNAPPKVEDVLNLLGKGDVVTHCYNNKANGLIREGKVIPEVKEAIKRGVLFDVGHGSESFSLDIAGDGIKEGFEADMISTDLYERNMVTPVESLENTMNKMIYLGWSLEKCVEKVTYKPARAFKIKGLGELKEGYMGDLTIFDIVENGKLELEDSVGKVVIAKKYIKTKYVFIKNELIKREGI